MPEIPDIRNLNNILENIGSTLNYSLNIMISSFGSTAMSALLTVSTNKSFTSSAWLVQKLSRAIT